MKSHKFSKAVSLTLFLAVLFFAVNLFAAQTAEDADFIFAKKAFNDGFYDLAQARLENFLKSYHHTPYLYEAHLLLGLSLYNRNNFTGALYEFNIVLDVPEGNEFQGDALYWIGEVYFKMGDFKRSLEFYQKVIDGFTSSKYVSYAVYSKAWVYYKLGLFEDATKYFKEVVSKYPLEKTAMESQFRIGECEYLLGRYSKAREEFRKFTEKYPLSEKTAEVYYMSGEANFYDGSLKDSVASFQRAISIAPRASWVSFAKYRMARALLQMGDYEKSITIFKECIDEYDNDFLKRGSLLGIAENYEKMNNREEAKKRCDELISAFPDSEIAPEAYYLKVRILYSQGLYDEAGSAANDAISKFPKSEYVDDLHYELGWIYAAGGKEGDALEELVWVETESGDINLSSSALCKMGDIYMGRQDYRKAVESYDTVFSKYPDSFWADYAQYQLGNIFLETGKYDQAILAYQSVLINFPNTSFREKTIFQLGMAYFKREDFEHAASEFNKLIEEFPDGQMKAKGQLYLANALYNMSRYDKALPVFEKIVTESAYSELKEAAQYQIGWCYYNMKKDANAIDEFNKFLKDYPRSNMAADVKFWFSEYYRSKSRYDLASEYLRSLEEGSSDAEIAQRASYDLASIMAEEGKGREAIVKFEAIAARDPQSALAKSAYRKIAALAKKDGDFDSAIGCFKKVLTTENNESNAQVQYEIAELYEDKGDLPEATQEYLKVPYLYSKGPFWAVRAQLKCAKIFERLEKIEEAKRMYEKLAAMDVEESKFAKERLEWLRWRGTE